MKKFMKKNNKGFSLVELIVVILIMAIIAVALAPQVMKWVGESSKSTDNNNMATIKGAVSDAVADYVAENGSFKDASGAAFTGTYTFKVLDTGISDGTNTYDVDAVTKGDALGKYISKTMGSYPEVKDDSSKVFQITVKVTNGIDAVVTVDTVAK